MQSTLIYTMNLLKPYLFQSSNDIGCSVGLRHSNERQLYSNLRRIRIIFISSVILNTKEEGMPQTPPSPFPFLRIKKMPSFCPLWGLIYHSKYSFKNVWDKKLQHFPLQDFFSLIFWGYVYRSALISRNLPCLKQFLIVQLHIYGISNLIFVHWNCIDSIYRNIGGLVVWCLKRWPVFDSQPRSILSTVNYLQLIIFLKKFLIKHRSLP